MKNYFKKTAFAVGLSAVSLCSMAQNDWSYLCRACDAIGVGYDDISGKELVGDYKWKAIASDSQYVRFIVSDVPSAGTYDLTVWFNSGDAGRHYLVTVKQGDKKMCTVVKGKITGDWDDLSAIGSVTTPVMLYEGENIVELTAFGNEESVRNLSANRDNVVWGANLNKIELKASTVSLEDWSAFSYSRELESMGGGSANVVVFECNKFALEAEDATYITAVEKSSGDFATGSNKMSIDDLSQHSSEGRGIVHTWAGDFAYYENVDFGSGVNNVKISHNQPCSSKIELWVDPVVDQANKTMTGGKLVGTVKVSGASSNGWNTWGDFTTTLSENISGVHNLCLVFLPDGGTDNQMDYGEVDKMDFFGKYISLDDAGDKPVLYNYGNMKAGRYLLEIDYANWGQERGIKVGINDGEVQALPMNISSDAWDVCRRTGYAIVRLAEGDNTIKLYKDEGFSPNLDKMRLTYLSEPNFEKVTIAYSMTAAGWGTLMLPFGQMVPASLTLYTCEAVDNEGVLQLKEVERDYEMNGRMFQYAQANTPYVVGGDEGAYANFSGMVQPENKTYQKGILVGTTSDMEAPVESYVLQNQEDNGVAFYRVGDVKPAVKAWHAYMLVPEGGNVNARALTFPGGGTTGIAGVVSEDDCLVDVFHINGTLVRHHVLKSKALEGLQKGLYIVDGVKRVIK